MVSKFLENISIAKYRPWREYSTKKNIFSVRQFFSEKCFFFLWDKYGLYFTETIVNVDAVAVFQLVNKNHVSLGVLVSLSNAAFFYKNRISGPSNSESPRDNCDGQNTGPAVNLLDLIIVPSKLGVSTMECKTTDYFKPGLCYQDIVSRTLWVWDCIHWKAQGLNLFPIATE